MKILLILFFGLFLTKFNDTLAPPNNTPLEVVSGDGLRVRATACTNGRIITTLSNGARLTANGKEQVACGHTWWGVKGGFGEGWAASNWLRVVNNNNLVYGTIQGLDAQLISKLADVARLMGSRVHVHSGCRPGDPGWHGIIF
jgi:hypothetical protein